MPPRSRKLRSTGTEHALPLTEDFGQVEEEFEPPDEDSNPNPPVLVEKQATEQNQTEPDLRPVEDANHNADDDNQDSESSHHFIDYIDRPVAQVLNEVVERVCFLTGASGAIIALIDREGLICRASTGTAPVVGSRLQSSSGLTRECLKTGQVVFCEEAQHDPRVQVSVARSLRLGSAALAPIVARGTVLGVLEVFSARAAGFDCTQLAELMQAALFLSSLPPPSSQPEPPTQRRIPAPLAVAACVLFITVFVLMLLTWRSQRLAAIRTSHTIATTRRVDAGSRSSESVKAASPATQIAKESEENPRNSQPAIPLAKDRAPASTSVESSPLINSSADTRLRSDEVASSSAAPIQIVPSHAGISVGPPQPPSIPSDELVRRELEMPSIAPPRTELPILRSGPAIVPATKSNQGNGIDVVLDRSFKGHSSWITSVAFSADGQRLASGSWDRSVKVWDVRTGQQLGTIGGKLKEVQALAFSRDGRWLATENSNNSVTLWDGTTGREIRSLPSNKPLAVLGANWVYSIAFSPDGRWLASAVDDKTIRLWDVRTGVAIRDLPTLRKSIIYAAFSPDGRWLASGEDDQSIRIWDASTGQQVKTLKGHKKPVYAVAFSPSGRWLASASADKSIKLWDLETGREVHTLTGHKSAVTSLAFSPDGRWLASGSWDKTVRIWDTEADREIQTLTGHDRSVYTVAFDARGQRLASGSEDGTIKIWRVSASANPNQLP
jgi:WD40 repeat protein